MKHFLSAAVLLGTATLGAQEAPRPVDPVSDAWIRFSAQHDGLRAVWNKATGTPKAIFGDGLKVVDGVADLATARGIARDVLARYDDVLGLGTSTYVESVGRKLNRVYLFVYDQRFGGLEVVGGRADVRLHDNGVVSMFGSSAVQIPADFGTAPAVPMENAWALAHQHLNVSPSPRDGEVVPAPNGELVIHADPFGRQPTAPRLAWRVGVDVRNGVDDLTIGKVYVDARTGEVIEFVDEVYSCWMGHTHVAGDDDAGHAPAGPVNARLAKAMALREGLAAPNAAAPAAVPAPIVGNVRAWINRISPTDPLVNEPLQGIRVTAAGVGSAFTDANGDFSIPHTGTAPVTVSVNFGTGSGQFINGINPQQGSPVTASVTATPGVPAQIQILSAAASEFDWSQTSVFYFVDDAYRWVTSVVGSIPGSIDRMTATVNRASTCNAFYTGNTINFYARGGSCNMTAFDSVIYHEWGHGLDNQFGGINQNEGISEGWGDIVSCYRLDDPIVGRNFTTSGGFVRSALNTRTYPTGGFSSGGAPHPKGEVWMGWAWQVREGLKSSLGNQAGAARADAIVLASIAANHWLQPDAVREVFILDDDDGNLNNGVPNYTVLETASRARNYPFPEIQVGTIAHTPLQSSTEQFVPQIVRATVTPISGSFTAVDVVFDVGGGEVRQPMAPSGQPNEYVSLLPGVPAPSGVRYRIEARHSTNITLRAPESGEYGYSIGTREVFFSEDFESGASGWQSFLIARQNDWQLGAPTGRSGTSNGVAWTDPSSAASGNACYGNDLGIGNFNGEYQPNVHNYLRSPTFSTLGKTGVTLRFQRWLTVEESQYDRAEIRVNNQVVWVNPVSGNLVDTQWTNFELPIPQADNLPLVQIEWRLITDGGLNLGGWAIDDVEVLAAATTPPPPVEFTLSPAQVPLNGSSALAIAGTANAVAAVLFSDSEGPTTIPGIGELAVGANFFGLGVGLDANGAFQATFPAGNDPSTVGVLFYLQAVELAGSQVNLSNKSRLLIGN